MKRRTQRYGWRPDLPDHRDRMFRAARPGAPLPGLVDLSSKCPPIFDQGQLGSCTANAISAHMDFCLKKQGKPAITPSRLMIYYNERVIEGAVEEDAGAQIRDGIKVAARQGACPESVWPYDEARFAEKPDLQAYRIAMNHQVQQYMRLQQDATSLKHCLAEGFPFVFGFSVFENFEARQVAETGNLGMPGKDDSQVGGHAVYCVGYNDLRDQRLPDGKLWPSKTFLIRNSWGKDWGIRGMFTIPEGYVVNDGLAEDFWTIRLMES